MVGGEYAKHSAWIALSEHEGNESDRVECVSSYRFAKKVVVVKSGKRRTNLRAKWFCRAHHAALSRHDSFDAMPRMLKERHAPCDGQQLLGPHPP